MQWSVAALLLVIASASLAVPTDDPARSTFYKPTVYRHHFDILLRFDLTDPTDRTSVHPAECTVLFSETLAPVEQYVSREVKATIGQETILDCFFGGNPIPEILWQNVSNHEIRGDDSLYEIRNYGRQLLVKHVREEDEGEFKCTAKNLMGETQIEIRLNATAPPRRVAYKGLTTLTRPDHSDVTLHCSGSPARGERAETPLWYRNGGRLEKANLPDPSRYKFSPDFTQLHIKDLNKKEDMACFQCNISNSEGYLFMDGYLRVI
ncbi:contactin-1, partial [Aplysia californica]|uniref:Contactin-1 n=1 Tax=Aplysia californica TaxID=6500 RepID=A0ABM1AF55_APLCA